MLSRFTIFNFVLTVAMTMICFQNCSPMKSVDEGLSTGSAPQSGASTDTPPASQTVYLADPVTTGRVLKVCPQGCPYKMPSEALAAGVVQDGDTIEIIGGDYVDCAFVNNNNIVIRGISVNGQRPHLHGKVCGRKGILVLAGSNILVENLELSDAVDPTTNDENWAGIRVDDPSGANIIVRNCYIHDSDDGILGNYNENSIEVVEDSKFERLGRSGYAHGMYIGTVKQFVLRHSIVLNNHDDGHLVKTRALASIIECNSIAGLTGVNSFAIDVPQGGDTIVRDNVIENGPNANNHTTIINYAEEGAKNPVESFTLADNVIINDTPSNYFLHFSGNPNLMGWTDNLLVGPGQPVGGASIAAGWTQVNTRAEAGLPTFDGTVNSLPSAPACP